MMRLIIFSTLRRDVYPNHYVKQRYLPESLGNRTYYKYGPNKTEQAAKRYWDDIKGT